MTGRIAAALILLSALSLFMTLPQPFVFVCALIQVFFLPGLVFSLFFLAGRVNRTDQVILSILLSPILISILSAAVNLLAGNIYISVNIVLIASYLLLVPAVLTGRHKLVSEENGNLPRAIIFVSIGYAALILISYLVNDYLLIRSDSWYHAAVVREVMARGIPPKEPLLADFSIRYMWFYHLFQALWIKRSDLSLFHAMAFFNIINAFLFPYLVARFASYFTDRKSVIVLVVLFAIAGLDSASWIFFPTCLIRAFVGEVRGVAEIQRIMSGVVINGSAVIHTLSPYGTWMVNLYDKFITITAFSYSFNLFLASLALVLNRQFMRESRAKSFISLFVIILGTLLFHAITGIALVMTAIGASVLMIFFGKYLVKDGEGLEGKYLLPAAATLAAAVGLPYILSLGAGAGGDGGNLISNHIHLGIKSIITISLPLVVLFFPARAALRKIRGRQDFRSAVLICWSAALCIIAIMINLPTVNDSKLIFPLFLIIGPPIYIEIVEGIRKSCCIRRGLIIFSVAVLFLIPLILTFRGFVIQKPDTDIELRRHEISEEDRCFFEWIKENTPDDSVIIENNIYHLLPVFAARRNFYSTQGVIRVLGYGGGKMGMYENIQSSIYGQDEFSEETIREMRKVDSKLYIALWKEDFASNPWLFDRFSGDSKFFKRVFSSDRVSLYTLRDNID